MATFNVTYFEFDSKTLGTTVGDVIAVTPAKWDQYFGDEGTMVVTDNNNLFSDDSDGPTSENATADVTGSNGVTQFGVNIDLEAIRTYEWIDGDGVTQSFQMGELDFNGGGGLTDATVVVGKLPPPNTIITLVDYDSLPRQSDGEGFIYGDIICFTRGTMILTDRGEVAVEDLSPGDMVMTRDRGAQPLRWVGSRKVPAKGYLAPITIKAGALGNDRDLTVSPAHRMLVTGWKAETLFGQAEVLATARQLLVRDDVYVTEGGTVEYFHLLFDNHEIVTANGAPSESLNPSELALDHMSTEQRDEVLALFPELIGAEPRPGVRPTLRDTDVIAL